MTTKREAREAGLHDAADAKAAYFAERPEKRYVPPTTPLEVRVMAKVDRSGEHWLWTGAVTSRGYPVVRTENGVTEPGRVRAMSSDEDDSGVWAKVRTPGRTELVHRLMATWATDTDPRLQAEQEAAWQATWATDTGGYYYNSLLVRQTCGQRRCVRPDHLTWTTKQAQSEAMRQARAERAAEQRRHARRLDRLFARKESHRMPQQYTRLEGAYGMVTLRDTAKRLGKSYWQVWRFVHDHHVPTMRLGSTMLVKLADLRGLGRPAA